MCSYADLLLGAGDGVALLDVVEHIRSQVEAIQNPKRA